MATKKVENKEPVQKEITEHEMETVVRSTGETLASMPKVKIKIPIDPLNKTDNSPVSVTINGYNYYIKKGESVEVPEPVADILEQAGYI